MKNTNLLLFILLASVLAVFASNSFIQNFSAESNGDSVTIRWTSTNEDGIKRYEVERNTASQPSFRRITTLIAKGTPSSYSYIDNEAFMKEDVNSNEELMSQKTYNYRLKITLNDNSFTYSDIALVQHKPSSIRRTWGMIKEMFR